MQYNLERTNGQPMPLLMGYTQPSKIKTLENDIPVIYDPISQMVKLDFGVVGTKSLKSSITRKRNPSNPKGFIGVRDEKNEIDDRKNV